MIFVPLEFFDAASGRHMKLDFWPGKSEGSDAWIFFKHPDGQWVSLRKATPQDIESIEKLHEVRFHTPKEGK